jgi:tryptophan 7-halogenase
MESGNIARVAILGAGVAGWMSAAFLANMLGPNIQVTLVDLGDENEQTFDEASLPPLKAFLQNLGISEQDLIAKTQGSMKLGTQFVNWGTLGNRYFHPHGAYGAEFDAVPLHQYWLKARQQTETAPDLADLSLACVLASESRFTLPVPDRRLIQSTIDYAYHMDTGLLIQVLADYAMARGVVVIGGALSDVTIDSHTGFVTQLNLVDGQSVPADLFLDCSGQKGRLIKETLNSGFEDWSAYLPCNRAISISCARGNEFSPFTRVTAREAGWQWRIPLQHKTSTGYIFAREQMSDDSAIGNLMDNLDGRALAARTIVDFTNGKSTEVFKKNVVALGGAAGFLDPLETTSLHLIQSALFRLLALWPKKDCDPVIAQEYNRIANQEWHSARDLLILHYKATTRADTPFWQSCMDMEIPDSLKTRLALWQSNGRLVSPHPEVFQSSSWLSVLVGQSTLPVSWDPLADARADRIDFVDKLLGLKRVIAETASQMPVHKDWVEKHARGPRTG